ncbi:MAG: TetR/AcrR family transcriptional regulator [Spirochaetales bacterium]|nr:TetR/AcrR family transcriptional regulator [Spirochaetales bacterium]
MARHQDDEKRDRILQASIKAFQEKGFTTTTMKDIADRAGIAPGSIYTYFQDKEVLFIAAVDTVWKGFYKGLKPIISEALGFEAQLKAMLDYGFQLLLELHPLVQGMYQEPHRLNLFHKNMVKLAKQLAFFFEQSDSARPSLSRMDRRSRMNLMKIWISGMMFTLSSLPANRIHLEITQQRKMILLLLLGTPD